MTSSNLSQKNRENQSWRKQKSKYSHKKFKGIKVEKIARVSKDSKPEFRTKKIGSIVRTKKIKNKSRKSLWKILIFNKKMFKLFFILFILGSIFSFLTVAWLSRDLPNPNELTKRKISESTKIYDRTGENILYEIHGEIKRTLVPLEEIPDYVKWAIVAIEDKNFYKHGGFSYLAILRAIITRKGGGSTLTQQFTKNTIFYSEKNKYIRKIKEWILTPKIEKKFTKDEILQMYLNEMPYGSTAYGVEAASQLYFGKSVREVNLPEAAVLAAIIQAPSRYSPYGPNRDLLLSRQKYVLKLMHQQGYITEAKRDAAKLFEFKFKRQKINITAPHFVMYIKEILARKYGEKMIEQEGLQIYTTLDLYKQKIAEEVITEQAQKNEEKYEATNAALVSINPKTGEILAMVGSRDYFSDDIDGQFNVTTSSRQPGSSMKPLVYASLFNKGYTPNTILYDVVTNFSLDPEEDYEPHNYDNKEHGAVSIRKSLACSFNIPAVKAIYLAGINNVLDLAKELGYSTLANRDRFGLSLVLGGGEVKLLEHVNAYSAFAREGEIRSLKGILKIKDSKGKIIEEFDTEKDNQPKRVFDKKVARMINDILSDNEARSFTYGLNNWLTLGNRPVAAKTGTTNDYRDAWTIGYTPSIVTGVWVGNNSNKAMEKGASGGRVAAPIWHNYMERVLGNTPVENFNKLEDIKTNKPILDGEIQGKQIIKIDRASGFLATENTPKSFIDEIEIEQHHSILYYVDKNDPLGSYPKKPEKDSQFKLWEERVLAWSASTTASSSVDQIKNIPNKKDNLHTKENKPSLQIFYPKNKQVITENILTVNISTKAVRGVERVEYYINNNLLFNNYNSPFNLKKDISFLNNGFHNLRVKSCDDIDNCTEKALEFNLKLKESKPISPIDIGWVFPSNGIALSSIDFPLKLTMQVSAPEQIAKIDIFLIEEDNNSHLITTIQPVSISNVSGIIESNLKGGTYKLYGQALTWDGRVKKSEKIVITVGN